MKELMRILREILVAIRNLGGDRLAYSLPVAAEMASVSLDKLRQHINSKELVVSYVDHKPVVMHEELERWLRERPSDRPEA